MFSLAPVPDDYHQSNIDPYQQIDSEPVAAMADGGMKARALYDYQASMFI